MVCRPLLRLALVSRENRLSCHALVDSGADDCVFPLSFMQPLGLNPLVTPKEATGGIGGTNHFANISIDVQGLVRFPVYAAFNERLDPAGHGLLGQWGFFSRFKLHFRLSENIYVIED